MADETIDEMRQHMQKSLKVFEDEMQKLRTGRANPSMIEDLHVDYYGTQTPLQHIANVTAPDANMLLVRPFDKNAMKEIEKAIVESDLGLNPSADQDVIRVVIPKLTEERRKELIKHVHDKAEETKVAIRNIRRDLKDKFEKQQKEGEMSEDDVHRVLKEIDDITHEFTEKVDEVMNEKEEQLSHV
ncbi:MAG: ribosome recycling factor [Candidatus Bipolaricaulia bacterium]